MTPEERAIVEHFARSLGAWHIMEDIDFDAPADLKKDGQYYSIIAAQKDGTEIELCHKDKSFSMRWGKLTILGRARFLMKDCPRPNSLKQSIVDHMGNLFQVNTVRNQLMREFDCHISVARKAMEDVWKERNE
jgi:hypothetical protein